MPLARTAIEKRMMTHKSLARSIVPLAVVLLAGTAAFGQARQDRTPRKLVMPPYAHVFVIIEENHTTDEIVPSDAAPNLTGFAQHYGYSWRFFAETHPSEPNYIATLGGDTFGIKDDDAFWCKPKMKDAACPNSMKAGYVDHTVSAPSLMSQLAVRHLTWKGYFEDIPASGSRAYRWPADDHAVSGKPAGLYTMQDVLGL